MKQIAWIEVVVGGLIIGLTTTLALISAYFGPVGWREASYGFCATVAVLTGFQMVRAVVGQLRHERRFASLSSRQDYLARPEAYRQFDMLFQQQAVALATDEIFREQFEIDSTDAAETRAQCTRCEWRMEDALAYVRRDAVEHFRLAHLSAPPATSRWRRVFETLAS
jgi:hypothetical protein